MRDFSIIIIIIKNINGKMFTVTTDFIYMNVSRFKQFETFFTDGFEIRFGLNKIG